MIEKLVDFALNIDKHLGILIHNYGPLTYFILFFIIFMETGFVLTPFLPGDSLLFVSGAFAATGVMNIYYIILLFSMAAILGDTANYWIGSYFGKRIIRKFVGGRNIKKTEKFYEKYGKKTIVIARFVPVIRTFAPFVAGISRMKYGVFLLYNVAGGIAWVSAFVLAGYFFGTIPIIEKNLTVVILIIIFVSLIPAAVEYVRHVKNHRR